MYMYLICAMSLAYMCGWLDAKAPTQFDINHCNRLVREDNVESVRSIPTSWYNYTRQQVDGATRKQAVKDAFQKWYEWPKQTKSTNLF